MLHVFATMIATRLGLGATAVDHTLQLLQEGCTVPFIARYRKERTGSLNEVQIAAINDELNRLDTLAKRKETILKQIEALHKLTPQLKQQIDATWDASQLEDLYLPYKPKRRTKAQIAREQGLEPLADLLMLQRENDLERAAQRFVKGDVKTVEQALQGAADIVAERINENAEARGSMRKLYKRQAVITSKVARGCKDKEEAQKFTDYFDFQEPLSRCAGNRLLAIRRGEKAGVLKVSISVDDDDAVNQLERRFVRRGSACTPLMQQAVGDAWKRLMQPSLETEFATLSKQKADEEAIQVFATNLRQLLLAAPLGAKRIMGADPGIRTGCKVVALDAQGNLLYHTVVYPFAPKGNAATAVKQFADVARRFGIEAIAVGNGTASRETTDLLRQIHGVPVYVVSEDGASVYSASETAREEFPDEDITVRGAVSIARRLMDPLAELVKIDPKSIGVGQYQHDVDQAQLKQKLTQVVESCVNSVGVNVNTASKQLLTYVSGVGPTLAQNIVDYRREHGAFTNRRQLLKVKRLGSMAYEQCAGFLRIMGGDNALDNTAVHPESYPVVELMCRRLKVTPQKLAGNTQLIQKIDPQDYITPETGLPTLRDILKELAKPGLDPRGVAREFHFSDQVHTPADLEPGMVLPGIVTNITKFGAFVDIGVHQDGLVHISQLCNHYVTDPAEVVKLHQEVQVRVLEVDTVRKRISLSMKL